MNTPENKAVIAVVFQFDKLFPNYSNDAFAQTKIDTYNESIRILDRINANFGKYVDLYLYTNQSIDLHITNVANDNNKKVGIGAKNKILPVLPYFKNIIYEKEKKMNNIYITV